MPIESQYCRGVECYKNHLPHQIFCDQCDDADSTYYQCEKCEEASIKRSLFCAKHQEEEQPSLSELMKEIKSIKTTMQEIDTLKTMMVRMSDHFEILVSRLDLLEKQ